MSNNICIHHTDAERDAWRIGCPICLSKRLAAVTAERDALDSQISHASQAYLNLGKDYQEHKKLEADLSTSQQEAQRLREAWREIQTIKHTIWAATGTCQSDCRACELRKILDGEATHAPVHSDTEKDNLALSDLLQDCHSLFLKIAAEDDKEQFQINAKVSASGGENQKP